MQLSSDIVYAVKTCMQRVLFNITVSYGMHVATISDFSIIFQLTHTPLAGNWFHHYSDIFGTMDPISFLLSQLS